MNQIVIKIIEKLHKSGFKAYIAGGAVRDMILGLEPHDYDIATNAGPEDVEKLFDKVIPVGKEFGVVRVLVENETYEIARFREDGPYMDGRRPETINYSDESGDVKRRDFTMNALFYDTENDNIIDLTGGIDDIKNRIVRTVGDPYERFSEDYLRMLRAVRMAAKFNFKIDARTMESIKDLAERIREISFERIGAEVLKTFRVKNKKYALDLLDNSNLLYNILPEINTLKGIEHDPCIHPEGDVYQHTRKMLELYGGLSDTLTFGIIFHDCGKALTKKEDRNEFGP